MNNVLTRRNIIVGGILILIIIIVIAILFNPEGSNNNNPNPSPSTALNPTSVNNYSTGYHSFEEFIASGRNEACTFSININGGTSSGLVYAGSGKVRSDFTINVGNRTVQEHIIIDSFMAYMWANSNTTGVKFALQDRDPNQFINSSFFKCTNWTPDYSVFNIPANVAFTEIGSGSTVNPTTAP